MGFLSNSNLKQFSCGDVIPGSGGMLTLAFGPASDALSGAPAGNVQYPFWFGWYRCNMGEELKRFKNSETYIAYYVDKGGFKILSENESCRATISSSIIQCSGDSLFNSFWFK